jgi:hypothetical protein
MSPRNPAAGAPSRRHGLRSVRRQSRRRPVSSRPKMKVVM